LEYRGYDSAGIAIVDKKLQIHKRQGMIKELEKKMPKIKGTLGISHTRWATHGEPSERNAHPHFDCKNKIAVVHNGIIENYAVLKDKLIKEGHKFKSETDTEILVHLIEKHYYGRSRSKRSKGNPKDEAKLVQAVKKTLKEVKGSFAIGVIHADEQDKLIAARNESPLVIGLGDAENFIASDVPAILKYTNKVIYIENGELAVVTKDGVQITDFNGKPITHQVQKIKWSLVDAEKGGFDHFMLKEIFEQPQVIRDAMLGRISRINSDLTFDDLNNIDNWGFDSIKIIACGSSYHAGLIGKYIFEKLTRIPTSVELASEYRYSETTYGQPLVILITQSGETADTLAAAREAKRRGSKTIGVTNVVGSSITREVDNVVYIHAGPEICVCATKSFIAQLIVLYLLAITVGGKAGFLKPGEVRELTDALRTLPTTVRKVLNDVESIKKVAAKIVNSENIFFIGRNINYPTALEGALKLKEISYIHAEGYPAGELKHGPLALLTPDTPVVVVTAHDHTYDKILGNIGEVGARNAPIIAVGYENDIQLNKYTDIILSIPEVPPLLSPIPASVVLQLLAYYAAKDRGCPIDKPRNLAKSVTVE
jgi:glucosamine--fructose-6-phosphate aminotransferase (isomerizing)